MRKIAGNAKSRPARKSPKRQKSGRVRKSAPRRKARAATRPLSNPLPPPPGRGKRGEAGYFGYLLRQAAAAARLTLERALAGLGATPPQFLVLTMLKTYPGLSGAELARVAVLTPQTVGVIIRNLERGGAIKKTRHPVHGRVLQWSLTRRGLTLLARCRRHAMALERRLAAGLNRKEARAMRRWLSTIAFTLQT
jgi:DNA-binding MarR family transcriptional regulator